MLITQSEIDTLTARAARSGIVVRLEESQAIAYINRPGSGIVSQSSAPVEHTIVNLVMPSGVVDVCNTISEANDVLSRIERASR